jgi:hypothetical protein
MKLNENMERENYLLREQVRRLEALVRRMRNCENCQYGEAEAYEGYSCGRPGCPTTDCLENDYALWTEADHA